MGVDPAAPPTHVPIPAGKRFALITIVPLEDADMTLRRFDTVVLALQPSPLANPLPSYGIGWPGKAAAIIFEECDFPVPYASALPDRCVHLNWPGTNGANYCLEISTNLTDWTPVCTNTVVK